MKLFKSLIRLIKKLLKKKAKVVEIKNYDAETDWLLSLDEHETKISS